MSIVAIIVAAAVLSLATGLAAAIAAGGLTQAGILEGARVTARWSLVWFLAAWSASSLARLWPGGWRKALLRNRRSLGLGFAASHAVHAGFFLIAILGFGVPVALPTLIFGGLAYGFIALMAATSSDAAVRVLGPVRWKILHATGGWVILAIFLNSYISRLGEKPLLAIPALALIGLAILIRALAAWGPRQPRMA